MNKKNNNKMIEISTIVLIVYEMFGCDVNIVRSEKKVMVLFSRKLFFIYAENAF